MKLEIPNSHTPIILTHCQNFDISFDADATAAAADADDADTAADAADNGDAYGGGDDVEDDIEEAGNQFAPGHGER